jgi:class 3 adenylate cyclase
LDGQLYSASGGEHFQAQIQDEISRELKTVRRPRHDFIMRVQEVPHRVYCQALNPDATFPPAYQVCLYSLAEAEAEKRALRVKLLISCSVALLGALALSLLISHGLSVPIRELVNGTAEIERGNFNVKVPIRSRDEIGHLAASFNQMADGLALKEKYRSVLNMVADKGVADELVAGKIALGGEIRQISVLFCDIRGFTALTQDMPPTEVIQMLNEHMTALTQVVYEYNGVVDKFVGDLVMALFGAPKTTGRDAFNAAHCALRMIQERDKLNETARHKIKIGIGVATGSAVAGCMGSADRLNYTVLGERVNLASRLCGVAGRMEVVIDQTTKDQLADLAVVEALPDLKLKGFSMPVTAYKLLAIPTPNEQS